MFALRIVHEDKAISNQSLGDNYTVTYKDVSPEKFNELFKHFDIESLKNSKDCYALLAGAYCKEVWPIMPNRAQFIMTESGKTFEKL